MTGDSRPAASGSLADSAALETFLAAAATRGERAVSACRAGFCLLVFARYLVITGLHEPGARVVVPSVWLAIGVSVLLLVRSRRRSLTKAELALSVVTDAVICFTALVPNILWPWPYYEGLFATPDPAALIVVAMTAGFRLYPAVTLAAGVLHLVSFGALAAIDLTLWGEKLAFPGRNISILAILLVGAVTLASLSGARALRLARAAATHAVEVERTRSALTTLLREHHDVRSFLSSATLNSDVILRSLATHDRDGRATLTQLAVDLREDLMHMQRLISELKERSFAELATLEGLRPADVHEVMTRVASAVARRFRDVEVRVAPAESGCVALVLGGGAGLERVALNLLGNACEGDGDRAARHVEVSVTTTKERVVLEVADDGPGFPPTLLGDDGKVVGTSGKPGGSGFGLKLTAGLVEGSGGSVRCENRPKGGARVVVELPRAKLT